MNALLKDIWDALSPVHGEVYSLLFAVLGAIIFWIFRARVLLYFGRATVSRNVIRPEQNDVEIFIDKYFIQNSGKAPASQVEFILSAPPNNVSVSPSREHTQAVLESGEYVVRIPYLAPTELITVDCLYINQQASFVASVKCMECVGRPVNFWTIRNYGSLANFSVAALIFLGIAFIIQVVISVVTGAP